MPTLSIKKATAEILARFARGEHKRDLIRSNTKLQKRGRYAYHVGGPTLAPHKDQRHARLRWINRCVRERM